MRQASLQDAESARQSVSERAVGGLGGMLPVQSMGSLRLKAPDLLRHRVSAAQAHESHVAHEASVQVRGEGGGLWWWLGDSSDSSLSRLERAFSMAELYG